MRKNARKQPRHHKCMSPFPHLLLVSNLSQKYISSQRNAGFPVLVQSNTKHSNLRGPRKIVSTLKLLFSKLDLYTTWINVISHLCLCSMPSHYHELNLITARISSRIHSNVWDEITYPFSNFNDATFEVWERINNFIPHFIGHGITYPHWDWSKFMLIKGASEIMTRHCQCSVA